MECSGSIDAPYLENCGEGFNPNCLMECSGRKLEIVSASATSVFQS
tara:strand:- start:194 stop:331 length:138 start_codon:yes stop_codon:yes gene_type:complete